MKFLNNKLLFIFATAALVMVSCSKERLNEANENPNAPRSVVPAVILPSVETSLAYVVGGDLSRFTTLLVQHSVGFSRQAQAYYSYVLTSSDFDTYWGNTYTSIMGNNKDLLDRSDAGGFNVYSGISRMIMAYTLQLLVDNWGSVPYTQALQGNDNTQPAYDDAEALYATIEQLVDKGIEQLSDPDPGALTPGSDDIIYGGDTEKWIKFGHAIKARLFIHQSKGNPAMAARALAEANMSFEDNSDNAVFMFGSAETAANPIYQFNQQRGDIDYGSGPFIDFLTNLNDPRLMVYTTPDYSDINQAGIGDRYGSIGAGVELITYEEMQFVKGEAILRSDNSASAIATAQAAYQEGIRASMTKLGIAQSEIDAYIAANGTLPAVTNNAIAQVAFQEYLALYLNPEAFTLWRRTGSPTLTPVAGTNGIPRRLLYPQSEFSLNGSNVPQATLYTPKIFWDK